jgi:hypothetical protein
MRSYILGLLGGITGALLVLGIAASAERLQAPRESPPLGESFAHRYTSQQVLAEFGAHGLVATSPPRLRFMEAFVKEASIPGANWVEFSTGGLETTNGLLVVCDTPAAFSAMWSRLDGARLRLFAQGNVILAFSQANGATAQRYETVLAAMR